MFCVYLGHGYGLVYIYICLFYIKADVVWFLFSTINLLSWTPRVPQSSGTTPREVKVISLNLPFILPWGQLIIRKKKFIKLLSYRGDYIPMFLCVCNHKRFYRARSPRICIFLISHMILCFRHQLIISFVSSMSREHLVIDGTLPFF